MPEILHRQLGDLLRSEGNGRTIVGRVVPFNEIATVDDGRGSYEERFVPGSFQRTIAQRASKVKLLTNHDRTKLPIGSATSLREERDGLWAEFQVADVAAGNEALELVRSGVVDSFSIGFSGIRERRADDGVVERHEVVLREVSLVGFPSYAGAQVAGVRSQHPSLPLDVARQRLTLLAKRF